MNRGTETSSPSSSISPRVVPRKRKDGESSFLSNPKTKLLIPAQAAVKEKEKEKAQEPVGNCRLLACYMAYEFLTRGTLLGQKYEVAESEARRVKPEAEAEAEAGARLKKLQSYEEVATVLKTGGAHIPGLVNPTQLAQWIRR